MHQLPCVCECIIILIVTLVNIKFIINSSDSLHVSEFMIIKIVSNSLR